MRYEEIAALRAGSPAWRLLRADNAPLILSFLGRVFVEENVRDIAASQQTSEIARTLMPAASSPILQSSHQFALGSYSYSLARQASVVEMKVSDGSASLTAPLVWALGVGRTGQSYL